MSFWCPMVILAKVVKGQEIFGSTDRLCFQKILNGSHLKLHNTGGQFLRLPSSNFLPTRSQPNLGLATPSERFVICWQWRVWCPPHLSGLQLLPCCRNPSSGAPASNNPELLPGNPCPIPAKRSLVPALKSVSSSSVTSNCFICLPRQLGQDRPQLQKIKVKTSSIIWWKSWGLWYLRWRIFEQDKQLPIPRPPLRRKLGHRLVFSSGPPHKSNPNLSLAMLPFHTLSSLQKKK